MTNVLWIEGELHDAFDRLNNFAYEAIVINSSGTRTSVAECFEELRSTGLPIIVCDENASIADTVRYMRLGAHDVATYNRDVSAMVQSAVEFRKEQRHDSPREEPWRSHLVGSSAAIKRVIEVIRLVGGRRSTILITGETGTGKEMIARAVHLASPRAQQPMVAVNCNALPENLLEAELFGHVKGAFTGALQHRVGRFEQAHRGTLFLDEIGDLSLDMQTKLLRVLQEREFQRIGSGETIRVDVRIIAATNVNLAQRVEGRKFREDLYYRLNVVPISAPPLRDRLEDIPALAHHFVEKICRHEGIPSRRLSPEVIEKLRSFHWPGNVRQLENMVEMAVALSGDRQMLYPSDFALPPSIPRRAATTSSDRLSVPVSGLDFEQTVGQIERQILEDALKKTNGNKTAAAGMLGLKRTTLAAKLKSLEAVAS